MGRRDHRRGGKGLLRGLRDEPRGPRTKRSPGIGRHHSHPLWHHQAGHRRRQRLLCRGGVVDRPGVRPARRLRDGTVRHHPGQVGADARVYGHPFKTFAARARPGAAPDGQAHQREKGLRNRVRQRGHARRPGAGAGDGNCRGNLRQRPHRGADEQRALLQGKRDA